MKTEWIVDGVMGLKGVAELNEMQRAMAVDGCRRVMITAPTGSGKTIAFVIRMLREVKPGVGGVQGLVVAPTRELVLQVAGVVRGILNFEGGMGNFLGDGGNGANGPTGANGGDGGDGGDGQNGGIGGCGDSAYASSRGYDSGDGGRRRALGAPVGAGGRGGERSTARGVRCVCLYGGHDMRTEVDELAGAMAAGAAVVVVATPGRLVDHLNRRTVDLSGVRCVVVDEFDKCLEMGFQGEMRRILNFEGGMGNFFGDGGDGPNGANGGDGPNGTNGTNRTNRGNRQNGGGGAYGDSAYASSRGYDSGDGGRRRALGVPVGACVVLTSATRGLELPGFVGDAGGYRRYEYGVGETSPAGGVSVTEVVSPSRDKLATLSGILRSLDNGRVIVFVNHRESAERVFGYLKGEGWPAVLYHGGLDQQQRRMAVELLANGSAPVMVATDLAARGLDIEGVEAVVHYHVPVDVETWTHRNGRTGRQGAAGKAIVILNFLGDGGDRPTGAIGANMGNGTNMANGDDGVMGFLRDGEVYEGRVAELGVSGDPIRAVWESLYINAGKKEKISKGDVAGYVMKMGGLKRDEVGRIAVDDHYAMVAVPKGRGREVVAALSGAKIKGRRVRVSRISN